MDEHIEIEFKILLNKQTYQQILEDQKNNIDKEYYQTNYYLMHPILQRLHYALRIREKQQTFELTLKRKAKHGNLETNIPITKEIKDKICNHEKVNNEIFSILEEQGINIRDLDCTKYLITKRTDIIQHSGIISLDYNQYNEVYDYELEFEVHDYKEGKQAFLDFIKPYHLSYTKNSASKIKRVIQTSV